jgi:hypothetical protein
VSRSSVSRGGADAAQTVFDTTDGAIVLFGSAGSEVKENKVYARTRMVMGGE